jgi:hypothetical protein
MKGFRQLLKALAFSHSGQYLNTARIDPKQVYAEEGRLKIVSTRQLAIHVMTGYVAESFLVTPGTAGPSLNPWTVHKITIAPFTQDMRRDTSFWGMLLDFHVISSSSGPLGFTFTTRPEDPNGETRKGWIHILYFTSSDVSIAVTSTPKRLSSNVRMVSSALVSRDADDVYGSSRAYEDRSPYILLITS